MKKIGIKTANLILGPFKISPCGSGLSSVISRLFSLGLNRSACKINPDHSNGAAHMIRTHGISHGGST